MVLTTHWHDSLTPDSLPALEVLAEPDHVEPGVAGNLPVQVVVLLHAVDEDLTIPNLGNWTQI